MTSNINHSSQDLVALLEDLVISVEGEHTSFNNTANPQDCDNTSVIFLQNENDLSENALPAIIVASQSTFNEIKNRYSGCVICVKDTRLAMAYTKAKFDDYDAADAEWPDIHPSAVVHESASIGEGCRVGPGSVIGANVLLGNYSIVRANCVIEHNVVIGEHCVINSLVNIGYDCKIGSRVIIKSGTIIGGEGFGFAQDPNGKHQRIPHTGFVVIEDDVSIGTNCCVDRGTYGSTRIGRGTKMDNLCHIAHNVDVGEDVIFVAQCGIAGSSKIGDRAILSGQVGVLDHMTIAEDAVLVLRAGVTRDIPHSGVWAGTPAKPLKEHIRETNLIKKVTKLEKQLKELKSKPD